MLFLTLMLTDYHMGLSMIKNQGWRWSVTILKLSESKIKFSSRQSVVQQASNQSAMHTHPLQIEVSEVKGQNPRFFLADMVIKLMCHFNQVVNFEKL
jgi:hypothetical protein